jgi:hypothetical protein
MSKMIGILNKGKDTKIVDCSFDGFDIGIQDQGRGMKSVRNDFTAPKVRQKDWYQKWWIKYIILPLVVLLVGGFLIHLFGWN